MYPHGLRPVFNSEIFNFNDEVVFAARGRGLVQLIFTASAIVLSVTVNQVFFPHVAAGSDFRVVIKF
jgi:hypothetical protein